MTNDLRVIIGGEAPESDVTFRLLQDRNRIDLAALDEGDPRVRIVEPSDGDSFTPGTVVRIRVDIEPPLRANDIKIRIPGVGRLAAGTNYDGLGYEAQFDIPKAFVGPITLIPSITDTANETIHGEPVTIAVRATEAPEEICLLQRDHRLNLAEGELVHLALFGVFADGSHRDIASAAAGTTYVSRDPSVVVTSSDGLLTPAGVGVTTVSVQHLDLTDWAVVRVHSDNERSAPADVTAALDVRLGALRLNRRSGFFVQSLTITNPFADPAPGPLFAVLADLPDAVEPLTFDALTRALPPVGSPGWAGDLARLASDNADNPPPQIYRQSNGDLQWILERDGPAIGREGEDGDGWEIRACAPALAEPDGRAGEPVHAPARWDAIADTPAEAANLRLRSQLMEQNGAIVAERGWTRREAAQHCGVTQPRMNDLLRGRIFRSTPSSTSPQGSGYGCTCRSMPPDDDGSKSQSGLQPITAGELLREEILAHLGISDPPSASSFETVQESIVGWPEGRGPTSRPSQPLDCWAAQSQTVASTQPFLASAQPTRIAKSATLLEDFHSLFAWGRSPVSSASRDLPERYPCRPKRPVDRAPTDSTWLRDGAAACAVAWTGQVPC